jgi:hypothetical protein
MAPAVEGCAVIPRLQSIQLLAAILIERHLPKIIVGFIEIITGIA